MNTAYMALRMAGYSMTLIGTMLLLKGRAGDGTHGWLLPTGAALMIVGTLAFLFSYMLYVMLKIRRRDER